jgi:hypothetical protein
MEETEEGKQVVVNLSSSLHIIHDLLLFKL